MQYLTRLCHVCVSTLPSPTLPCGIQANSMESMWIPHGFQVKCPKKEIFAPECMESLWNPCGIHPHSRFIPCRVQKEVFSDYLHGIHGIHGICMDSTWIPDNITKRKCLCLKSRWTAWNPYGIHMDSRQHYPKEKIQKNPKKNPKKYCDHKCIRIMISCYAKMKSVANISLVNNQWPLMYNACH